MNRSIALVLFVSLGIGGCGGAAASAPSAPVTTSSAPVIDGTSYDVTLSFPGEAPMKDTLIFSSGRFESTACTSVGFPEWTEYRTQSDGDGAGFDVTTHHPQGGSIVWHGTARGGRVTGTASRTLKGTTEAGTFEGIARR
jgi:hypothetical protein